MVTRERISTLKKANLPRGKDAKPEISNSRPLGHQHTQEALVFSCWSPFTPLRARLKPLRRPALVLASRGSGRGAVRLAALSDSSHIDDVLIDRRMR